MALSSSHSTTTVDKISKRVAHEYVRDHKFSPYMGESGNAIFKRIMDLTKNRGETISDNFVGRLKGAGVRGSTALKGAEDILEQYGNPITVDSRANGVVFTKIEQQKVEVDFADAARVALKKWLMQTLKLDIIQAMAEPANQVKINSATQLQLDTWLDNNYDRILFGNALGNTDSSGGSGSGGYDFSDSIAAVDASNDTFDSGMLSLAKRIAKEADPHITPVSIKNGDEYFVAFTGTRAFRDFAADSVIQQANRDARQRGMDNPLFTGGALMWDGCIVIEVPEITTELSTGSYLTTAGNSSITVEPVFVCGAEAIGIAWAQEANIVVDMGPNNDYGRRVGVGVEEIRGVRKSVFNSKDNGIVTIFAAGVADS